MFNKLKQFKDLRDQAKKLQNALAQETVEASAAWGKVKIVMNGNQEIVSVSIDPELLNEAGKEKLESAVKEAANDAVKKVQKVMAQKMQAMGGLNFPGMG